MKEGGEKPWPTTNKPPDIVGSPQPETLNPNSGRHRWMSFAARWRDQRLEAFVGVCKEKHEV